MCDFLSSYLEFLRSYERKLHTQVCSVLLFFIQTWELQSTSGEAITLKFDSFALHASNISNCFDWVEVNDGSTTQRYCGYTLPGPFTSTSITVKFHTGSVNTADGFLAVACCSVDIIGNVDIVFHLIFQSKMSPCYIEGTPVSCGLHTATSCSQCPQGHGASWCNGDCLWLGEQCIYRPPNSVRCGGHYAPSCSECPQENGASWCNGDCIWADDECNSGDLTPGSWKPD